MTYRCRWCQMEVPEVNLMSHAYSHGHVPATATLASLYNEKEEKMPPLPVTIFQQTPLWQVFLLALLGSLMGTGLTTVFILAIAAR